MLAQRQVDRVRAGRRTTPLPDEEPAAPESSPADPDRNRYLALIQARSAEPWPDSIRRTGCACAITMHKS